MYCTPVCYVLSPGIVMQVLEYVQDQVNLCLVGILLAQQCRSTVCLLGSERLSICMAQVYCSSSIYINSVTLMLN